jgi:hypothetical protein
MLSGEHHAPIETELKVRVETQVARGARKIRRAIGTEFTQQHRIMEDQPLAQRRVE